jgi:hypothetical protein
MAEEVDPAAMADMDTEEMMDSREAGNEEDAGDGGEHALLPVRRHLAP